MITVYGISNCDTVKKARAWLAGRNLAYEFHDFKKSGVPADRLDAWAGAVGSDKLINRQGTTWRKLDSAAQGRAADWQSAKTLLTENSSLIKRPLVEWEQESGLITVGFDAKRWESIASSLAA